jgi:Restriction endonuclease
MLRTDKLRKAFEALQVGDDAADRGREFERLLHELLLNEGFKSHLNPEAASPRQTDIVAILERQHFLIEAKWRGRNVGVGDIDDLRARLNRTASDFAGCIFNMSDFGAGAIEEVTGDRSREILLFNAGEINSIFSGRITIEDLIRLKREALRIHARVYFLNVSPNPDTPVGKFPAPRRELRTDEGNPTPYVSFPTKPEATAFFLELPDVGAFETFVSITLRLDVQSVAELAEILNLVRETVGLSEDGCFNIHQLAHSWHGFGAKGFLEAIEDWEQRYVSANLQSPHHSEDLSYVDILGGVLIALTSRQRVGSPAFLFGAELEIQFAGIPVDLSKLQELCKKTGNAEARFETHIGSGLFQARFVAGQVKLAPVQKIVTVVRGEEWVTGVVVKNPFNPSRMKALASGLDEFFQRALMGPKYLVCAMDDWYPNSNEVTGLSISKVFGVRAAHGKVLNVHCRWENEIRHTREEIDFEEATKNISDVIGE